MDAISVYLINAQIVYTTTRGIELRPRAWEVGLSNILGLIVAAALSIGTKRTAKREYEKSVRIEEGITVNEVDAIVVRMAADGYIDFSVKKGGVWTQYGYAGAFIAQFPSRVDDDTE
jgi:hypothetical protein